MNLLEAKAVSVRLGGRNVVENISFSIAAGEFVGLIGPNGAGKSTLLKACLGLNNASGNILLQDTPLAEMSAQARGRAVSYLPQEHEIAWPVSVRHLVELGRQPWLKADGGRDFAGRHAIARAIARLGITELAERPANTLSGGERARVLIARALAQTTPLLLADEPAAGLDPAHQIGLMKIFRSLLSDGHSVVSSMHDLSLAARWCTRLIMIDKGHIVADDRPENVLTADNLRAVYGVEAFFAEAKGGPVLLPLDLYSGV
ncbi:ABC transporter ATP-binding protein [Martelella mediterranea]|uniref:Iron complex transport system ATP-binding protein n=1 Tax=Martelella mediterranea TaxID=293089 RepID=A0A4R3NSN2_9HYPH|nr:ABC transporter ATP-binding protein [Martelella mediterranea]TCT40228.1 iron complex transport system ATP-binding protein [Martelella mediterranea]